MNRRQLRYWRRGEADRVDLFTIGLIVLMAVAAVVAVVRIGSDMTSPPPSGIAAPYGQLLTVLHADCRQATAVKAATADTLALEMPSGSMVQYQVRNGELVRSGAGSAEMNLLSGVKTATFVRTHARLLQVLLTPADSAKMPFFTSFALRGVKP